MIKVSVIVPTYRRENQLKKALISISSQTYKDFEIVLIDDNGNREWNNIIEKVVTQFKAEFPQVKLKYIRNEKNLGSAEARNVGICNSEGEFVTFLDDDDIYLPDKIAKQLNFMVNGGYDFSVTDLYLYNANEKLINKRIRNYIKNYDVEHLRKYNLKYHITGTDTVIFKKDYLNKIGGFKPINIGDEFYLMQEAIDGKGKFGYLPGCDVKAYIHSGNDGLSSGMNKITGEKVLYKYKKQFFSTLDNETIRYIKMRHYAVIAFAEIRMARILPCLLNMLLSFVSAPVACVKMFLFER